MILSDWIARLVTPVYATLLMEGGVGFIIGLCVGFVAKNFGRIIAYFVVALWILLVALAYFGIITIHYDMVKGLVGMPARGTIDDGLRIYTAYLTSRMVGLTSGMVGVVIGWRVA